MRDDPPSWRPRVSVFRGGEPVHPVSRVIVVQRLLIIYGITAGTKGNPSFAALNSNRRLSRCLSFLRRPFAPVIESDQTWQTVVTRIAQSNAD